MYKACKSWIPGLVKAEAMEMEKTLPGAEKSILTSTSSSFINCLGPSWRQLMQTSFNISTDHSASLIIVLYVVSICLYSTCHDRIKILHGYIRFVMLPGGYQDLLMLCRRSGHYLAQSLFSLFLSAILTYSNLYIFLNRRAL